MTQSLPLNPDALEFYNTFKKEYLTNKIIHDTNNYIMQKAGRLYYDSRVTLGINKRGQLTETPWYYHYSKPT